MVCFCVPGTLKLMDSSEQLKWSVQVDHQLFALQKLDVTVSLQKQYTFIFSDCLWPCGFWHCDCASVSRATAERRWRRRVPGMVRPTSSTTTAWWWGFSLTRTSMLSVQVRSHSEPHILVRSLTYVYLIYMMTKQVILPVFIQWMFPAHVSIRWQCWTSGSHQHASSSISGSVKRCFSNLCTSPSGSLRAERDHIVI